MVWTVKCDSQIIIIIIVAVIYICIINTILLGSYIYFTALKYIFPNMISLLFTPPLPPFPKMLGTGGGQEGGLKAHCWEKPNVIRFLFEENFCYNFCCGCSSEFLFCPCMWPDSATILKGWKVGTSHTRAALLLQIKSVLWSGNESYNVSFEQVVYHEKHLSSSDLSH